MIWVDSAQSKIFAVKVHVLEDSLIVQQKMLSTIKSDRGNILGENFIICSGGGMEKKSEAGESAWMPVIKGTMKGAFVWLKNGEIKGNKKRNVMEKW